MFEGEGTRGPWRCGAIPPCAGCRGNCWYFMGGRSPHASARSSPLSHSWTNPSRTLPPRPAARFFLREAFFKLYMAWLWILFICQLRPLDAFPAFLLERRLRRNVWEMTVDLFHILRLRSARFRIFQCFRTSPLCLVRLRIQILRQSLIAEWIGRTIRTVCLRCLALAPITQNSRSSLAEHSFSVAGCVDDLLDKW